MKQTQQVVFNVNPKLLAAFDSANNGLETRAALLRRLMSKYVRETRENALGNRAEQGAGLGVALTEADEG